MSSRRVFTSLAIPWLALPGLAIFLAAIPATAQSSGGDYLFLVGSGFLCDSGDSSACPGLVRSDQRDSYEMSGAGSLSTQGKTVTGAGTFTHKSAAGNALETGVWIASELVSFDSYGLAPGALIEQGLAPGPQRFGPKRLPMLPGAVPAGGRAVFRIRLLPLSGASKTALLQVNCALANVPSEHRVEGIRLTLEGGGPEFDEELSGRTLFLLTRSGAGAAVKAAAPEVDPNLAPAEVQE